MRILTDTRMRRMKLNRGGDGDAHHRSTTDRVGTDKCICRANLSDVRFRERNRPPLSDFVRIIRKGRISDKFMGILSPLCYESGKAERMIISVEKK